MDIKQEPSDTYEEVVKRRPHVDSGQTEETDWYSIKHQEFKNDHSYCLQLCDTVNNCEYQAATEDLINVDEIKLDIVECVVPKIEQQPSGLPVKINGHSTQFLSKTIKKDHDIVDISETKQEVSEYIQPKIETEILKSYLQILKSESTEYSDNLIQPCSSKHTGRTLKAANAVSTKKKQHPSIVCKKKEYCDYQENNQNDTNLPSSNTVEFIGPVKYESESVIISTAETRNMLHESIEIEEKYHPDAEIFTEVHCLSDEKNLDSETNFLSDDSEYYKKKKIELLDYLVQREGSVICKRCGEVLSSKAHWYRHNHKVHEMQANNKLVSPLLFKCHYCNVFFKSRKDYTAHIAFKHSESQEAIKLADNKLASPSPVFKCHHCNVYFKSRRGYTAHFACRHPEIQEAIKLDMTEIIVKRCRCNKIPLNRITWKKKVVKVDLEERAKEEKLIMGIINRVKKECEAEGKL